jgi:hypothetical protein
LNYIRLKVSYETGSLNHQYQKDQSFSKGGISSSLGGFWGDGLELIAKSWDWSGCDLAIKTSFSCPGIDSLSFGSGLGLISFFSLGNSSKMLV